MRIEVNYWNSSEKFYPKHQDFNRYYALVQANLPAIFLYTIFAGHRSLMLEPRLNHQIKERAARGLQTIQLNDLFENLLDEAEKYISKNPPDARYVNLSGICATIVENEQVKI